ncbi:hypothetical protein GALL_534630 [mine drainage metagenome]|uniref:Uncharacterized protein n=1 Tax=mine drainage metagenome TaxID=410659 RepID=A0A1J5PBW7_9ZZZZ
MTPPKAAQSLIELAKDAKLVYLPCGHHQMTEAPEEMRLALKDFLTSPAGKTTL